VSSVEVKAQEFARYVSVEYEEFDPEIFDEIISYTRSPHRIYRKIDEKTIELMIGLTHPVFIKVITNRMEDFVKKIRSLGFRLGEWKWK